jgi:hypothetical protein
MRTIILILALCGCDVLSPGTPADAPRPSPLSCNATCNSNLECSGDILMRCKFCSFGKCSSTSPLSPADAGADSPATTERTSP